MLHDLGRGDWLLASLVCKTLWNYRYMFSHHICMCVCVCVCGWEGRGCQHHNYEFLRRRKISFTFFDGGRNCFVFLSFHVLFSEKLSSSVDCLGEQERLQLIHILTSYSGQPLCLLHLSPTLTYLIWFVITHLYHYHTCVKTLGTWKLPDTWNNSLTLYVTCLYIVMDKTPWVLVSFHANEISSFH